MSGPIGPRRLPGVGWLQSDITPKRERVRSELKAGIGAKAFFRRGKARQHLRKWPEHRSAH